MKGHTYWPCNAQRGLGSALPSRTGKGCLTVDDHGSGKGGLLLMLCIAHTPDDLFEVAGALRAGVDTCQAVNELASIPPLLARGVVRKLSSQHVQERPR
eukprot:1025336-Pelagomonas_calceolata.AAC.1